MKNHNGTAAQTNGIHPAQAETEILPRDKVLIVGGGPVGLNLATVLAHYGVKSIVLERNSTTTRHLLSIYPSPENPTDHLTDGRRWI